MFNVSKLQIHDCLLILSGSVIPPSQPENEEEPLMGLDTIDVYVKTGYIV